LFIWRKYFKNLLIELHLTRKAEIYVKAFWHITKGSLLKPWFPRWGGATTEVTVFTCAYIAKYLEDFHFKNQWSQRAQIYIKVVRHSTKASLLQLSSLGVCLGAPEGRFWTIFKTVEFSTPKLYIILFLVSSSMRWHVSHDHTGWSRLPLNRKCPNISKTVEIPIPKPYIFLFLVSSSIWWYMYVSRDHTEWSSSP
jgi:hypothetical protein